MCKKYVENVSVSLKDEIQMRHCILFFIWKIRPELQFMCSVQNRVDCHGQLAPVNL